MKKQTLNEEFKRMQKLAGLVQESKVDEIGMFSDPIGYDKNASSPILMARNILKDAGLPSEEIDKFISDNMFKKGKIHDLAQEYVDSLMMNENLEEGWKTWALGGLMSLATLAGIGKAYVPNIDSLSSKQKTELSQNAYRDALKNMSKEDVDTLWSQVNKSNIKDNLKQNQFSITSDTDKETADAAWPDMQRAELETAISKNLDRFVIDSTGTVIFISNPTGFTAIKEENISRISKSDFKNMIREMALAEAKKDEKEEEDVEIEDTETVDTEEMPTEETPQGNPDDILDALKTALDGAKALGDEKLVDQIGNTITFYTRVHIVGQETDMN